MRRHIATLFVITGLMLLATTARAQDASSPPNQDQAWANVEEPGWAYVDDPGGGVSREPGWSGPVIARGPVRAHIEATPIPYRSYRPFHFYGNTVRRMHYRGTVLPNPSDIFQGGAVLLRPGAVAP